ncbi:MAG: NHL repeat-containing protein [Candidatus Manganitrophus sp.]|nr:NHL repeat-containing protein [Candidatus Manganitrophus sp.]MDC4227146.1 NHL repeat-containing protein [Candidatus Manganitrophus sp.]WDT71457.1 MAG: NHL repeat-containing protein [Candidatus Manganitrophus sp.]WDT81209.1 MAG: NHL repeat-containing protein [Candidatus Manganitrophus sp.]
MRLLKTLCVLAILTVVPLVSCGGRTDGTPAVNVGGTPDSGEGGETPETGNGSDPTPNPGAGEDNETGGEGGSGSVTIVQEVATMSMLSGKVVSGGIPISESTVALYEVGNTIGGTPLPIDTAITDQNGNFTVSLPTEESALIYLIATGGDAGNGPNSAVKLALILGMKKFLPFNQAVTINEVTTVAMGYTMNFFIQVSSNHSISGPPSFIWKAMMTALSLVDPATGMVQSHLDSNTRDIINGLADILEICVGGRNSDCNNLFSNTTLPREIPPAETLSALLNIVENPTNNVSNLWGLISNAPPYTITSTVPSGLFLTLNLFFYPGSTSTSTGVGLALDSSGVIWIANARENNLTEITLTLYNCRPGCRHLYGTGINQPAGIGVDASDNVWVASGANNSVTKMLKGAASDCSLGCAHFSDGGISEPIAIAVDASDNIWVANLGNDSITKIPSGATSCVPDCTNFSGGGISRPSAVAVDASDNIWVANLGNDSITKIPSGATSCSLGCTNFGGGDISKPAAIAIDPSGNVWVINRIGNSVTKISTGAASDCSLGCTNFTGGGINEPIAIAVDALGDIWVANLGNDSITKIPSGAISCSLGCMNLSGGGISQPAAIGIDASGSVWVANINNDRVTEIIGVAAPTKSPMIGPPSDP